MTLIVLIGSIISMMRHFMILIVSTLKVRHFMVLKVLIVLISMLRHYNTV